MERNILLTLRPAIASDFAYENGTKKIGVAYFEQASTGVIQPTIKYFTEETNINHFKQLYAYGQIWVMDNPNKPRSIFNCIDWDLIESELNYELSKASKVHTKHL